jgi:uncharacterized protein YecT (DUF1311 family)
MNVLGVFSMIEKLITILFVAVLLASCRDRQSYHDISTPNWSLEIDQPIRQLEETLETLEQQQPQNYTIANISFLYEMKLYLIFHEYLDSLPGVERSLAIHEQKDWMELHRKNICDGYTEYEGGTFAGYNAGIVAVDGLKKRIAEIQKRSRGINYAPD